MCIAAISLAERSYPANRSWNYHLMTNGLRGWARLGRDVFYLFIIAQLSALLKGYEEQPRSWTDKVLLDNVCYRTAGDCQSAAGTKCTSVSCRQCP